MIFSRTMKKKLRFDSTAGGGGGGGAQKKRSANAPGVVVGVDEEYRRIKYKRDR